MTEDKTKTLWLIESPVQMVEGETQEYSIDYLGAKKISAPGINIFLNGGEFASGVIGDSYRINKGVLSFDISARMGDAGNQYVVLVNCRVDGEIIKRKFLVQVIKGDKNDTKI